MMVGVVFASVVGVIVVAVGVSLSMFFGSMFGPSWGFLTMAVFLVAVLALFVAFCVAISRNQEKKDGE